MNVELRDLEYFVAVVETGGLTSAARRLHAAQPTLSHALARLESQVGRTLLDRAPRRAPELTDAGRLVLDAARTALAAVSSLSERLAELDGLCIGSLRVAASPSLTATLVPGVLSAFAKRYPAIRVSVRTLAAESVPAAVEAGDADVGIVAGTLPGRAALESRVLYRERLVAVVSERDPLAKRTSVSLASLRTRPLLLTPSDTPTSLAVHAACVNVGFEPTVALTLASAEGLRECARRGLGVAVLPAGYVAQRNQGVVAVPIVRPELERDVCLIRRGGERSSAPLAAGRFVEILGRVVRERSR